MKVVRYHKGGEVRIEDAPMPAPSPGELLVKTAACGLCSGELMQWYMDRKAPHVLGHEVSGWVEESTDPRFPPGSLVFAHHHANCGECDECLRGDEVHCKAWRDSRLDPGGMSEYFRVPSANLLDTWVVDGLRPADAALVEPLACVVKSISRSGLKKGSRVAVLGLGSLGLMHMLVLRHLGVQAVGLEPREERLGWAESLGLHGFAEPPGGEFDLIFILPGNAAAIAAGVAMLAPGGRALLFAPLHEGDENPLDLTELYFKDISLVPSYSCGRSDTAAAIDLLRKGVISAERVVSHFVSLPELPGAYEAMRKGEILKAMVVF